ncbi:MAG: Lpp/OprI family alanine-zipper lipoprotein [Thiotrichales bacterium]|nr:Lpp/OprI family alanine-zipper lipoprotein [Thiotrichales bacterium]
MGDKNMQTKLVKASLLAISVALLGGCSTITVEQLNEVRSIATSAAADANQAMGIANNALNASNEANLTALEAQRTAELALECCNDNSSKLDRMFQKAMMK